MTLPDPVFPKASGGVMAEGKEASCERGSGAEVVHTSAKDANRRDEIQEMLMTDTGVSGRLPAQPSTPDLNLWLVSRLKVEGSELTFGQIASIAKDLSAALSKAEAMSAPTPAPVSGERDWATLETAAWHLDQANKPALATLVRDAATALRTPHGLPGRVDEEVRKALQFYADAWNCKPNKRYGGLEWSPKEELLDDCGNKAKQALSRLIASREDGK